MRSRLPVCSKASLPASETELPNRDGCPAEVLGKVYSVVARRHGRIVAEEMKESTSFFTVTATLPVVDSFGFAEGARQFCIV